MRGQLEIPVRLLLAVGLLAFPVQAHVHSGAAQIPTFVVERVVDGDTVIIAGIGSVRLIGVDTPETVHPTKDVDAFGLEASGFLEQLVFERLVRLEYDWDRSDRYGRTLAYVYLGDGTFVNAEIIRQGYGHAYTRYPFKYLEEFRQLEREARDQKRGLWRDPREANVMSIDQYHTARGSF